MRTLLFWLYIWQLKEYRLDRFVTYINELRIQDILYIFFIGLPKRPIITFKILYISLLSVVIGFIGWNLFYDIGLMWLQVIICTYFFVPIWVTLAVLIVNIPTWIVMKIIVRIAKYKIQRIKNLIVIGITGSYGKTTAKEYIADVLQTSYKVLRTHQGENTIIAIAKQIIFNLDNLFQVYIVEMGAYKKGEINAICKLTKPTIGVLTGINQQHLALFGNQQNIIDAKFELLESLPPDGVSVVNVANEIISNNISRIKTESVLRYESHSIEENKNAAILVGKYFGINDEQIKLGLANNIAMKNRMQIIKLKNGSLINNTYSSNPTGFENSLLELSVSSGTKIVVTTGIYELGKMSQEINGDFNQKLGQNHIQTFLVEPMHYKYYPNAILVNKLKQLITFIDKYDNFTILLEGRHRLINQLLEYLKKNYA